MFTRSGIFVLLLIVGAGLVGFLDDWIGVRRERNLGLNKRTKMLGLLLVAVLFGVLTVQLTGVHTTLSFTRYDNFTNGFADIDFGKVGWVVWSVLLIMATTNAVNLTDGLDGLAAGLGDLRASPRSRSSGSGRSATRASTTSSTPSTSPSSPPR